MKRHNDFAPSLTVYRKKRDFTKTNEPSGEQQKAKIGNTYIIQKHAARRLHYDFRLELDGALKSWAVTRGPSLNPADKRLAVHVEDHPLDYATFEGTIPAGQYGGGTVMLWDRGTWEPIGDPRKDYAKGRLTFLLHGDRLKGEWHLVRMGGKAAGKSRENWLLIKAHDKYADERDGDRLLERETTSVASRRSMEKIAKGNKEWISNREKTRSAKKPTLLRQSNKPKSGSEKLPPEFIAPQLATLVTDPPTTNDWVHEIKFDGYRALCRIEGNSVQLLTRAGNDWTHKFRSIADQMRKLHIENALLDGEIVALDDSGAMSFHNLQDALSKNQQQRLHYHLFDLLFLNGRDLREQSLLERKKALRGIIPEDHPCLHYSEHFDNPGTDVLRHACHIALEGIVSKRADAPYSSGRSEAWLKSKCTNEQEFVIGGYTCQSKHAGELAAMLIGYYEGKKLRYASKVGTGFSHEEARQLLKKFKPLKQKAMSFASVPPSERAHVNWIEPSLVAAIEFTEWTEAGALRHPSYQGLREDKPADEVKREKKKAPPPGTRAKPISETKETTIPARSNRLDVIEGVTITHPDKVLYGDEHITKKDLADYYYVVADWILPHVAGRPISLVRCPEGSGKACFFQRHSGEGLSEYIKPVEIEAKGKREPYLSIEDVRGLIAIVQMGVLEIHVWGSRVDKPELPDRIVFDFDPAEDVPWNKVKEAAKEMKQRLADKNLTSFLKVTGGKGLHVVVPITRKLDWKTVKTFTKDMAAQMMRDDPKSFTVNSRKAERKGKIFIDYLRNDLTASAIAPYSTRARAGAPVALPIDWKELDELKNAHSFTMPLVISRLKKQKRDPWEEMNKIKQILPV